MQIIKTITIFFSVVAFSTSSVFALGKAGTKSSQPKHAHHWTFDPYHYHTVNMGPGPVIPKLTDQHYHQHALHHHNHHYQLYYHYHK